MRLRNSLLGLVLVAGTAACGGGGTSESTDSTLVAILPSTFRTIPPSTSSVSPTPDAAAADPNVIGGTELTYTVAAGDFPLLIDQRYGCKWEEVAAFNDFTPEEFPNKMYPGLILKLPEACTAAQVEVTTAETTASETAATEASDTTAAADEGSVYEVKAGDALALIAQKFDTTMNAIVEANGWSDGINHALYPGDKIKLPAPAPAG